MNTPENYTSRHVVDLIKSILLGLVILAAGIAIGASVTFISMQRQRERFGREPEVFAEQMLPRLGRELHLTPEQRRQLEPILRNYHETLNDIRASARPQVVQQLEEMNKDILAVLDEHQKQIWQRKARRIQEQFPTFRGPGRGPRQGMRPQPQRRPGMEPGMPPHPEQDLPDGPLPPPRHEMDEPLPPILPPPQEPQP